MDFRLLWGTDGPTASANQSC